MRRAPKDRADRRIKCLCYTRPLHYSLLTNTQSKSSFSILKLTILILAYLIYRGHWGCADKGAINVGLHIVVIKGQCIAMVLKLPLHIVIIEGRTKVNTVNIRSGNLLESLPYHYHHHGPQMYTVDISNSDSAIYIVHRPYTVRTPKKITGLFGNFSHIGGGLPNSQNFCKLTKYFCVPNSFWSAKTYFTKGVWWYLINFIT